MFKEIPGLEKISLAKAASTAIKAGPTSYDGPKIFTNTKGTPRIREQINFTKCPNCGHMKAIREAPCFNLVAGTVVQYIRCGACKTPTRIDP